MRRRPIVFAFVSAPLDTTAFSPSTLRALTHSVSENNIGDKGASALAAVLKKTRISELECAAAPSIRVSVRPIDMPQLPPPLPPFLLHPFRIPIRMMCCPRACAACTAAAFSCQRKGFPNMPTSPPFRSPRRSLWSNDISDQAKQAVRDAASNGVSITF